MAVNNSGKCLLFQLLNMWVHGVRGRAYLCQWHYPESVVSVCFDPVCQYGNVFVLFKLCETCCEECFHAGSSSLCLSVHAGAHSSHSLCPEIMDYCSFSFWQ